MCGCVGGIRGGTEMSCKHLPTPNTKKSRQNSTGLSTDSCRIENFAASEVMRLGIEFWQISLLSDTVYWEHKCSLHDDVISH